MKIPFSFLMISSMLFLLSCTALVTKEPAPTNGSNLNAIPENYTGTFINQNHEQPNDSVWITQNKITVKSGAERDYNYSGTYVLGNDFQVRALDDFLIFSFNYQMSGMSEEVYIPVYLVKSDGLLFVKYVAYPSASNELYKEINPKLYYTNDPTDGMGDEFYTFTPTPDLMRKILKHGLVHNEAKLQKVQ